VLDIRGDQGIFVSSDVPGTTAPGRPSRPGRPKQIEKDPMTDLLRPLKKGMRPASGLDSRVVTETRSWSAASLAHHLVVVGLAIAAALNMPSGPKRLGLSLGLATVGLGSSLAIDVWTRKTKTLHYQMMWLDQVYIASLVAIAPSYRGIVMMLGIAALAAEGVLFPPRTGAIGAVVGTAALWGFLRLHSPSFWGTPVHELVAYLVIGLLVAAAAATISIARQRAEEEIQRFARLMEKIPVGIYVFRLSEDIPEHGEIDGSAITLLSANPATVSTTGLDISAFVGRNFGELGYQLPQAQAFYALLRKVARTGVPIKFDTSISEAEAIKGGNSIKAGHYSLQLFSVGERDVAVSVEDITERVGAQNALVHQALHDAVTDLPNRVQLHQRLVSALALAERTGQAVTLFFVDINQFKEINDTLGHQFGDQLLRQVGERLSTLVGKSDLLARLGSDEFAIMRTSQDGEQTAKEMTAQIQQCLDPPFMLSGIPVRAGSAIGIVNFPDHGRDAETLLQRADIALFSAKRNGAGKATYSPDHSHFNIRRLTLLGELGPAIEHGEMVLHYQPKVNIQTGVAIGMEALVRWQHPRRGLLAPVHFIELAEISGLINQLTRWVANEGVHQLKQWREQGLDLQLATNFSVRNLHDYSVLDWMENLLSETGIPPDRLIVEITESAIIDELPIVEDMLDKISALGVHTSIDDFGTGYSSLSTLRRLPINEIKMDRSFVANMVTEEHDYAIVRSMVDLSHTLGIKVTAEGVEDKETIDLLVDLGCDLTQGYFFARPLPPSEFLEWVRSSGGVGLATGSNGSNGAGSANGSPAVSTAAAPNGDASGVATSTGGPASQAASPASLPTEQS
jgi:diguanylate cyclase (GGDEF)-like protein